MADTNKYLDVAGLRIFLDKIKDYVANQKISVGTSGENVKLSVDAATGRVISVDESVLTDKLSGIDTQISANENNISGLQNTVNKLDGADTTEGSVKQQIKSAVDTLNTTISGNKTELEGKISTNINNISVNSGKITELETKVSALSSATHFRGKVEKLPSADDNYANGDVIIVGQKEYIYYAEEGTAYSASNWAELGDTSAEQARITATESDIKTLNGEESDTGSVKNTAKSYADRVKTGLTNTITGVSDRVGTLETTVGGEDSGLVKDVVDIKTDINSIKSAKYTFDTTTEAEKAVKFTVGTDNKVSAIVNGCATEVQGGFADSALQTITKGDHVTVSAKSGDNGAKTVTIGVETTGKIEEGNTNIPTGGVVYTSIKAQADKIDTLNTTVGSGDSGLVGKVAALESKTNNVVNTFGGQSGTITVETTAATGENVQFAVSADGKLTGKINTAQFATSAQGAKADTAVQAVATNGNENLTVAKDGTDVTVTLTTIDTIPDSGNNTGIPTATAVRKYIGTAISAGVSTKQDAQGDVTFTTVVTAVTKDDTDGSIKVSTANLTAITEDEIAALFTEA